MNWEQKLMAIRALDAFAGVEMRKPGDWYVRAQMEHAEGRSCLVGHYGNGVSPEAAVEDHWGQYGDGTPLRTPQGWFRWNGYMWEKSERPQ